MAHIDYDQCATDTDSIGCIAQNIGAAYGTNCGEPMVYVAHCGNCKHGVYLLDHEPDVCPSCGCRMARAKFSAPVSALSQWQRQEMSASRERHLQMLHRQQARGQIFELAASQQAAQGVWGTPSMERMQERLNQEAQAQAKQLGRLQPAPARIKCAIKPPGAQPVSAEEQQRAVRHEVLDALDYLIQDVLECAQRSAHWEAISRNWAMRRAQAALACGRAMP